MAFGDPSYGVVAANIDVKPAEADSAPKQLGGGTSKSSFTSNASLPSHTKPHTFHHPSSIDKSILLDTDAIWTILHKLNPLTEPLLEPGELEFVYEDALQEVDYLLNTPFWRHAELVYERVGLAVLRVKWTKEEQGVGGKGKQRALDSEVWTPTSGYKMATTPMLGQFLNAINGFIKAQNETQITDWLVLEPPFGPQYHTLIAELRQAFPKQGSNGKEDALEHRCAQSLKAAEEGDQGAAWTQFIRFMAQYLAYLRDVSADQSEYLKTYELLGELQRKANSAFQHPSLGWLMLRIVVTCAKLVCRLAIGLDRKPELLRLAQQGGAGGEEGGQKETLPEKAANTIRVAFTTALNDRSGSLSGLDASGKPEGKKKGIYALATLCLKILFQCRKTRNATQIFDFISSSAPPLSAYPRSQRVTYLYYLGRFLFQNSHFYRAQAALQRAYDESPAHDTCTKQRRLILIYLIAANIILGRFPAPALLSRPEAQGLTERFIPICHAIRSGNLAAFRRHLSFDSQHADWFLHFRILLQLRNRCEPLVRRSLVRKTFILNGITPGVGSKSAPLLSIPDLTTTLTYLSRSAHSDADEPADPDFDGAPIDPSDDAVAHAPSDVSVEAILASLIEQGLLKGYVAHRARKFAILGAKQTGGNAVAAGFPNVWGVIGNKAGGGGAPIPGWKGDTGAG